ncbi:MAG: type II toxin-antitoxin system HicB family antitoxin [Candidatus Thioglobus sp.]|nr:type II toxin-antitoxin system HicB family antitoxin [Candidatus Thioglobus sp.]
MMKYKGYTATLEYDEADKIIVGKVVGIKAIIVFDGLNTQELTMKFHNSIDFYLQTCKERGVQPNKPYSGKFMLRMQPNQHAIIAYQSQQAGISMNNYVIKRALADCEI